MLSFIAYYIKNIYEQFGARLRAFPLTTTELFFNYNRFFFLRQHRQHKQPARRNLRRGLGMVARGGCRWRLTGAVRSLQWLVMWRLRQSVPLGTLRGIDVAYLTERVSIAVVSLPLKWQSAAEKPVLEINDLQGFCAT